MASSKEDKDATLVMHLQALRKTLIRCLVALGVGIIPAFLLSPFILDFFSQRLMQGGAVVLHYFSPMEVFLLELKLAALLDFVCCFPFLTWQIWRFILPALYENERRVLKSVALTSSFLFVAGVAFFLSLCFPLLLKFGMSFASESVQPVFGISNIYSLAIWLSLAFGGMFQFPIVTYLLIRSGIVSYESVCRKRSYVIVLVLIVAALLTPPDIVSQLMLGVPTYLLFELGLLFSRRFKGRKPREEHSPWQPNVPEEKSSKSELAKTDVSNSKAPDSKDSNAAVPDFSRPASRYQVDTVDDSSKWRPY